MRRWLTGIVFLLVTPCVSGQGTPGTLELTPVVGYWFGDTLTRGTTGVFDFDVTIDDAPAYGLRLAYRFSPHWALEGMFARENADLITRSTDLFGGRNKLGTIDLTTGSVGIEGSFGQGRVVGFFSGGAGAMRLDPNISGLSAETRFAGNFGGGFKLFLSRQVAVRFDVRGHSIKVDSKTYPCDWDFHYNDCGRHENWITFTELGVGLTFVL